MIARAVAFVKMPMPAKVKQIELVNQPVFLEKLECAVHRNACDIRIDLLSPFEYLPGIEMLGSALHHLKNNAALPRKTNAADTQFTLQPTGRFVNVDAFAGRNAMWGWACHGFQKRDYTKSKFSIPEKPIRTARAA